MILLGVNHLHSKRMQWDDSSFAECQLNLSIANIVKHEVLERYLLSSFISERTKKHTHVNGKR